MLSEQNIKTEISQFYSGVVPAITEPVNFPEKRPFLLNSVRSTITAAGAIVLPSLVFTDETGSLVATVPIVPWQFVGTTITANTNPAPDISLTSFFGPAISGFIPSEFWVLPEWSMTFVDFLSTPGVTFDLSVNFSG